MTDIDKLVAVVSFLALYLVVSVAYYKIVAIKEDMRYIRASLDLLRASLKGGEKLQ